MFFLFINFIDCLTDKLHFCQWIIHPISLENCDGLGNSIEPSTRQCLSFDCNRISFDLFCIQVKYANTETNCIIILPQKELKIELTFTIVISIDVYWEVHNHNLIRRVSLLPLEFTNFIEKKFYEHRAKSSFSSFPFYSSILFNENISIDDLLQNHFKSNCEMPNWMWNM